MYHILTMLNSMGEDWTGKEQLKIKMTVPNEVWVRILAEASGITRYKETTGGFLTSPGDGTLTIHGFGAIAEVVAEKMP